jgi:hypothetical protein
MKLLLLLISFNAYSFELKLNTFHKTIEPFEKEDRIVSKELSRELRKLTKELYQLPSKYYDFKNLKVSFKIKNKPDKERNKVHQDRLKYLFSKDFYENILYTTKLEVCNDVLLKEKQIPETLFPLELKKKKKVLKDGEYLVKNDAFNTVTIIEAINFEKINSPFTTPYPSRTYKQFDHQAYLENAENIPSNYTDCFTKLKRKGKTVYVTNFIGLPDSPKSLSIYHYFAKKDFNESQKINDAKNEILKYRAGELLLAHNKIATILLSKINKEYEAEFNLKYKELLKHPYFKYYKVHNLKKTTFTLIDVKRNVLKKATFKNNTLFMKDSNRNPISNENHRKLFKKILKVRGN